METCVCSMVHWLGFFYVNRTRVHYPLQWRRKKETFKWENRSGNKFKYWLKPPHGEHWETQTLSIFRPLSWYLGMIENYRDGFHPHCSESDSVYLSTSGACVNHEHTHLCVSVPEYQTSVLNNVWFILPILFARWGHSSHIYNIWLGAGGSPPREPQHNVALS